MVIRLEAEIFQCLRKCTHDIIRSMTGREHQSGFAVSALLFLFIALHQLHSMIQLLAFMT